jgi:hypothetical protein
VTPDPIEQTTSAVFEMGRVQGAHDAIKYIYEWFEDRALDPELEEAWSVDRIDVVVLADHISQKARA